MAGAVFKEVLGELDRRIRRDDFCPEVLDQRLGGGGVLGLCELVHQIG